MTTKPRKVWMTHEELCEIVNCDRECLSCVQTDDGYSIVRKTHAGEFAVIALRSGKSKITKILPTFERARSYNLAIGY